MRPLALLVTLALAAPALADEAPPFEIPAEHRISLAVPHAWPRAEARARIGYLLEYWRSRFGVKSQWQGEQVYLSGRVHGMRIEARFELGEAQVAALAADPGWLWRGKVHTYVLRKLQKYLHPTYAEPP